MLASFTAEVLKLGKRPATWVLALVWLTVVLVFGYLFFYLISSVPTESLPEGQQAQQEALGEQLRRGLLPENLLENLFVNGIFGTGGSIALILGALTAGSEYGWGTLKTGLTQRPGRLAFLSGKVFALMVFLLLFVLLGLAAGAAGSYAVALLEDAAARWPPLEEFARALGMGLLILTTWASLGFALATLFRGTALAIGLGLAWSLAVESTLTLLPVESAVYETFRGLLLGENTASLASYFGSAPQGFGVPEPLVEPERAAVALAVYAVVFVVAAAFLFRRRDLG
ncbi:MAG: ABC transporter permease subunit [Actinomycetota bacterium]